MCETSVRIFFMRQVFFVAAQQIKAGSQDIEREITIGLKKGFVKIHFKTIDPLFPDISFKKQGCIVYEKFCFGTGLLRIIESGKCSSLIHGFVRRDMNRFVEQFLAEEINNILQPGCNSMSVEQQHPYHKI